ESAGSQSPAYTNGAYRVDVVAGETYSLAVPVRNSGAVPFPVRMTAYFDPSGWETSGLRWLSPGETRVIKIENMVAPNDGTIRFSWRVDTNDPRLPVGGKLTLLDGITLVQDDVSPDMPFNGDGAKRLDTLLRRNVIPNGGFEHGTAGWVTSPQCALSRVDPFDDVDGYTTEKIAHAKVSGIGTGVTSRSVRVSEPIPVVEGQEFAWRAWFATEDDYQARMEIDLLDDAGDTVETVEGDFHESTGEAGVWDDQSVTIPDGVVSVRPKIHLEL